MTAEEGSPSGQVPADHPQLIGLDWGSTSCRAYLIGSNGRILDVRTDGEGVLALSGAATGKTAAFDRQLIRLVGPWKQTGAEVPMVSCGMVGSDQGWALAAYSTTPADLSNSSTLRPTTVSTSCGTLHIVPGLLTNAAADRGYTYPDVLRGEETQILGVLPEDAGDGVSMVILPGTHTKWAILSGSTVTNFATSMTGEIYALLLEHSILGRSALIPAVPDQPAFHHGLDVVLGEPGGAPEDGTEILSALFSARTLTMTGRMKRSAIPDYLSGLLIGTDVAASARRWLSRELFPTGQPPITICADEALASRYASALLRLGITPTIAPGDATAKGLWRVASLAGLVEKERP